MSSCVAIHEAMTINGKGWSLRYSYAEDQGGSANGYKNDQEV